MAINMRTAVVKFLQLVKLNRTAHHIYYRYFHGFESGQKEVQTALEKAFHDIKGTPLEEGDYCEFGIFKGYSFWHAQHIAVQQEFFQMRFFGFDSFSGLPEIGQVDQTSNDEFYQGQYSCSKQQVVENLNSKGIDWQRTFLEEGYFDKTLIAETGKRLQLSQVSIALIDCDLYSSTVEVLNFLTEILQDGSILLFDDWNCFNKDDNKGQRRAFREFLTQNPCYEADTLFSYGLYGQVFKVRRVNFVADTV